MRGIRTPGDFATLWVSAVHGLRLAAQRTVTRARYGALGESARSDLRSVTPPVGSIPVCQKRSLPRKRFARRVAWAFTLLGLDAYCAAAPDDLHAREVRPVLADRLMTIFASVETPDWVWLRGKGLAYGPRAPAAGLDGKRGHGNANARALSMRGLRSLRWLIETANDVNGAISGRSVQPASANSGQRPRAFESAPVEATATIAACLTAWRAEGDCRMESHGNQRLRLVSR